MATSEEGISSPIRQKKTEVQKVTQSKVMQWGQAVIQTQENLSSALPRVQPTGSQHQTPPEGRT